MSFILRAAIAGLAVSAMSLSAQAQEVGSVTTVTGDTGSVIVVRGSETFSLAAEDVLFEGDQVITQSAGATEITAYECTRTLGALEAITIAQDFCTQVIASVAEDGTILADAAIIEGGTVGGILPFAAGGLLAAGGVAAAAAAGDDDASSP
jgi:hypothetical protein